MIVYDYTTYASLYYIVYNIWCGIQKRILKGILKEKHLNEDII
jgi:hypothetical protein|tara:strand:+ start:65 stop:193 length:129 start_codon:yes stop_codon:yes gene_type:complete